jgi:hypothetical protein
LSPEKHGVDARDKPGHDVAVIGVKSSPPRAFVSGQPALAAVSPPCVVFRAFTLFQTFPLFRPAKQISRRRLKPTGQYTRLN